MISRWSYRAVTVLSASITLLLAARGNSHAQGTTGQSTPFYTHGNPTAEEQYVLELINRARANPAAEGDRLTQTGVSDPEALRINRSFPGDLGQLQADFRSYPARPPLGFNAALLTAAHVHNQDMTATGNYSHTGSDGSSAAQRAAAAGYPSTLVGENIDATIRALSGVHYKAMTDFSYPGFLHRHNLMNDNTWFVYREAGIAVGDFTRVSGPYVGAYVTVDLGNAGTALAVGVAYRDFNADGFYSVGEGIPGVVITSPASGYSTVTSASGGYSLPLDRLPDYRAGIPDVDVVFTDLNGAVISRQTLTLSGSTQGGGAGRGYDNVKADLAYVADGRLLSPGAPTPSGQVVVSVVGAPSRGGFVVGRQGDTGTALSVAYHVGGGAIAGLDYEPLPDRVVLPAGQSEALIAVAAHTGHSKVKVILDAGPYAIGKAQSKLVLADLARP